MARPRSAFASFLALAAGVLLVLGVIGLWVSRTVGDSEAFSSLAGGLLRQDAIVTRLAEEIVDPALAEAAPAVQQQRAIILTTTETVLRDARFVGVFEEVLRRSHRSLVDGDGDVRLRLQTALDTVTAEARTIAPPVADALEAVDAPEPVIVSSSQASRIRSIVAFERTASIAFLIGGAILLAIALIGGGPRAFVPAGVTVAILSILAFVLLFGLGALVGVQVPGPSRDAADSAYGVLVSDLRATLIVSAILGAVAAIAGVVLTRRG